MQQADIDMRFVPKEELVQSLLSSEEQERLWHDQFDLVPLRSHIIPEMVLSLHGWSHARLSLTSQQILQEATAVNCAYHWKHAADTHILHGVGEHQSCAIWATLWEEAITTEGRATFNLLITPSVQEGSFMIKAQLRSMVPLPPAQFMLWWAVRAVRSTLDCIKVSEGVFVALKWCKRLLWEGHLAPELGFDQLLALLQQLWNPVVDSEELRLIHGFSASRILSEQKLGHLRHMDQRGHAYVLHILTRIQGGGSGGKHPETVAVKNEIASILLDLQYDIAWVSKTVDTLFRHIGFTAAAALLRGNDGSKGRGILQAIESVGVDLPRKRSGAQDSQSSSRLAQVQKKRAPQIDLSGVTIMKGGFPLRARQLLQLLTPLCHQSVIPLAFLGSIGLAHLHCRRELAAEAFPGPQDPPPQVLQRREALYHFSWVLHAPDELLLAQLLLLLLLLLQQSIFSLLLASTSSPLYPSGPCAPPCCPLFCGPSPRVLPLPPS